MAISHFDYILIYVDFFFQSRKASTTVFKEPEKLNKNLLFNPNEVKCSILIFLMFIFFCLFVSLLLSQEATQECDAIPISNKNEETTENKIFDLSLSIRALSDWIEANGGFVNHRRIEVISTNKGSGVFTKR